MEAIFYRQDETGSLAQLRRLVMLRWSTLAAALALTLLVPVWLAIPLPQVPLLAVIAVGVLFNGVTLWRLRQPEEATFLELTSQLFFDLAVFCALVFFSGGAANPLVSLLLPPVAIAALMLPRPHVLATGVFAIAAYSLLMVVYVPIPLVDAGRAARLHLTGMWLTFAVSAMLIGGLALRMTALIRQRDAELAKAREQALRHERIIALGTLAAGAAHELGTPLGTMAIIAGELAHDESLSDFAREDVATLRQQIGLCKEIITSLSRRAGAERLETADPQGLDEWLETLRQRWHALRPQAESRLTLAGPGRPPRLLADPTLEQALVNLLNNAANAAAGEVVDIVADWNAGQATITVRDRGPGFAKEILALCGSAALPPHADGSGIGLMLTRAAVERLAGRLVLENPPGGGAAAHLIVPCLGAAS